MKNICCLTIFCLGLFTIPKYSLAQETEESAEVSMENYSDEFQENFFEALKQKGIENYDKAINLLLECKRIDSTNVVVDHELAKAYLEVKKYILAQEYGIIALNSEPANLWYLTTLVNIQQKQGNTIDAINSRIPYDNNQLKENLALIYYKRRHYQSALSILNGIKKSTFVNDLSLKIKDSLEQQDRLRKKTELEKTVIKEASPMEQYQSRIAELISMNDYTALEKLSVEALESFPAQPQFYYANGMALNKTSKNLEAITILEAALDFLLDDVILANKIYKELADAYTALGNTSKANMYLRKIKSGS